MATPEENKQLARDYFKAFLAHDDAWWVAHIADDFVRHDPGLPFEVRGIEGVRKLADVLNPGIPDMKLPISHAVAEGDLVLIHLRVQGTHGGELMGLEPTGKPIDIGVMDLFRFQGDKLVEHWALLDNLGLLKQLGVSSI
ncbi:ester cyclase [Aureimonas sp. Leaf324]|jgi:predicted ester cyclase|uniref:ester cyclase n=1 Tax=Aureimonas sp. Leaf324 TaxID=1736336 RepID=UPI0006F3DB33|nr:ester cyclase [Aureimonas sp. Leaf324]KQQ79085.1 hypothetical protein ASF65_14560 [Aureimonas sp. Leaf324]